MAVSTSEGLGAKPHRRNAMGVVMSMLNKVAGAPVVDRLGMKKPVDRALYQATKTGFQAAGAATRTFTAARRLGSAKRLPPVPDSGVFDLTPTEEQQLIVETVLEFAAERLRPAAPAADEKCEAPLDLVATAAELGITLLGVPEELGGVATERSTVTNVLVAEALATGDMGLALACLAPAAVSNALVLWGNEEQQATYLPSFTGVDVPAAALAIQEPRPLFDPFSLQTKAYRTSGGFRLTGVKSLVPRAAAAELFVIAADVEGRGPALFIVESVSGDDRVGTGHGPACGRDRAVGAGQGRGAGVRSAGLRPLRTMPIACDWPGWAGARWPSARARRCSTT